jgi:hypothetical protein
MVDGGGRVSPALRAKEDAMALGVRVVRALAAAGVAGTLMLACDGRRMPAAEWTVRFGPVIGPDTIVGRVAVGRRTLLATSGRELIRIDVDGHRSVRHSIGPLDAGEQIWGLAAGPAIGLWTLVGYHTLAQVGTDGRIERRLPLEAAHANVLSGHGNLLYQLVSFEPGVEAVYSGPPGEASRRPWGTILTRDLPLPRAQAALVNMISCGPAGPGGIPCWSVDRPVVTLTTDEGVSTDVTLEGLAAIAPAALFGTAPPRRPIFDVRQSSGGDLWVLAAGEPSTAALDGERGGWLLARHTTAGTLVTRIQLPEPARLLLGVTDASCILLSWNGHVVEVATERHRAE